MLSKLLDSKAASPIIFKDLGKTKLENLFPLKALLSISSNVSGNSKEVIAVSIFPLPKATYLNASFPILVTGFPSISLGITSLSGFFPL